MAGDGPLNLGGQRWSGVRRGTPVKLEEIPEPDHGPPARHERCSPSARTPSPHARSLIFGYRGSQGGALLAGIILSIVGTILTVVFAWGVPVDLAIDLAPAQVTGRIVTAELNRNLWINHRHPPAEVPVRGGEGKCEAR